MKLRLLFVISCFFLIQCNQKTPSATQDWQTISKNVRIKTDENTLHLVSGKFNYEFHKKTLPFRKVVLLNASLVGYLTELGLENTIVGISSPEYVYSEKMNELLESGKIHNVGNEQKYDLEKIISLKPDVVFTNYISTFDNTYDILRKNGMQVVFLNEYLEQNPLEKSKYLLVFGQLFNKEKEAETAFKEISTNYNELKTQATSSKNLPVVLANEMYGNQWYLPGGKTNLVQFLKDANSSYINAEDSSDTAKPMSFEEVFVKAANAEFWVNVGNHATKKELLQINSNYEKMKVFRNGKIFTITGREKNKANDYFESGVVRADWLLKDYIFIFHPELFPNYKLTYLKELK